MDRTILDDCPDEIRYARHGHAFHGVKMNRTNRMAGWEKTPQLNTLEGDPSEIEMKKALHGVNPVQRGKEFRDLKIRHTWDIIVAAERGLLPGKVMFNTHP